MNVMPPLSRPRLLLSAGIFLSAMGLILGLVLPGAMPGWLGAAVLFSAIPAGATYLVLMMRLIPGAWGEDLRLSAETASLLTPWSILAFMPVLFALGAIYPWMHGARLTGLQQVMLNPAGFTAVTIVRFAALLWASWRMRSRRSTRATAAASLVILPLLATLTAFVWLLSLEPAFTSSAFGLEFLGREFAMAFAALILLRLSIGSRPPRLGVIGGVFLSIVLFWAYIEFLSFFINWSGNSPDGARWYLLRGQGGSGLAAIVCATLGGLVLVALLFGRVRKSPLLLRFCAAAVIGGKVCEMAWIALPGFDPPSIGCYLVSSIGLGLIAAGALPGLLYRRIDARSPRKVAL